MVGDANGLIAANHCQRGTGFLAKGMPQGCVRAAVPDAHARMADVDMLLGLGRFRRWRNGRKEIPSDEENDILIEMAPEPAMATDDRAKSLGDVAEEEATVEEFAEEKYATDAITDNDPLNSGAIVPAYKSQIFGLSSDLSSRTQNGIAAVQKFLDDVPEDYKKNALYLAEEASIIGESVTEALLQQPAVEQALVDLKYNVNNAVEQAKQTLMEESKNYYEDKFTPKSREMIDSAVTVLKEENAKLQAYLQTEEGQAKVEDALEKVKQAQQVASAFVERTRTDLKDKDSQLSFNLRFLQVALDDVAGDLEEIIVPTLQGEAEKLSETEAFKEAIANVNEKKMLIEEKIIVPGKKLAEEKTPLVKKFLKDVLAKVNDKKEQRTTIDVEAEQM